MSGVRTVVGRMKALIKLSSCADASEVALASGRLTLIKLGNSSSRVAEDGLVCEEVVMLTLWNGCHVLLTNG